MLNRISEFVEQQAQAIEAAKEDFDFLEKYTQRLLAETSAGTGQGEAMYEKRIS
jgi:hypothetical protein